LLGDWWSRHLKPVQGKILTWIELVFITGTAWQVRERISDAVVVAKPFGEKDLTLALAAVGPAG
jgi:hypothetical protein